MVTVLQAYRFALDPTARQQGNLASHTGAARFAYNWGLELVATRLDQRKIDPSAQVPWTLPDLRLEWNRAKHDVGPWWAENSKEAYNSGLDALARALKNWTDSRKWTPQGPPDGLPPPQGQAASTGRLPVHHRRHPRPPGSQARAAPPHRHPTTARW
jgi:putative transposase